MWYTKADIWIAAGTVAGALFTLVAVLVAWRQLSGLRIATNDSRLNALQTVLTIEGQMNDRKAQFEQAGKELKMAEANKVAKEILEILSDSFQASKENYFNALDRLCFCILKNYLRDKDQDWRVEYRQLLHDTIQAHESDFGEASPFHNMKTLNRTWQSQ